MLIRGVIARRLQAEKGEEKVTRCNRVRGYRIAVRLVYVADAVMRRQGE